MLFDKFRGLLFFDNIFIISITSTAVNALFSSLDLLFSRTFLEGPEQMAFDEILLGMVERPLLRIYRWKAPCVTFGYFQKYELVRSLYPYQEVVRRWSGGGCVEHGEDITFSLMIPEWEPIAQQTASFFYRKLHETIVTALQQYGISARLAAQEDQLSGESCFVAPCPCDVMVAQKKIVGGAQRRSRGRLLYQGSLNFGTKKQELSEEKEFVLSLGQQLSPECLPIEERPEWFEEVNRLSLRRYRSKEWEQKR